MHQIQQAGSKASSVANTVQLPGMDKESLLFLAMKSKHEQEKNNHNETKDLCTDKFQWIFLTVSLLSVITEIRNDFFFLSFQGSNRSCNVTVTSHVAKHSQGKKKEKNWQIGIGSFKIDETLKKKSFLKIK